MTTPNVPVTTQQAYPRRASARTIVQTVVGYLIAIGTVLPIALAIVSTDLGQWLPAEVVAVLATVALVAAAVAGVLTKVMAIPAVDAWLQGVRLGSAPYVARHIDQR